MTVNKGIRRGAGLARLIMDSVLLSGCLSESCLAHLLEIHTYSTLWQYIPCGCEHIVDNFDTLILRLQVGISSVGFFCYILTYTAVGNPCASISCFPVMFVREGESPFCSWRQSNQIPSASAPFPPFPCVFIEAHGSFIFRTPAASPAPVSLPPFRGHISPVSVQTVAAPYPD